MGHSTVFLSGFLFKEITKKNCEAEKSESKGKCYLNKRCDHQIEGKTKGLCRRKAGKLFKVKMTHEKCRPAGKLFKSPSGIEKSKKKFFLFENHHIPETVGPVCNRKMNDPIKPETDGPVEKHCITNSTKPETDGPVKAIKRKRKTDVFAKNKENERHRPAGQFFKKKNSDVYKPAVSFLQLKVQTRKVEESLAQRNPKDGNPRRRGEAEDDKRSTVPPENSKRYTAPHEKIKSDEHEKVGFKHICDCKSTGNNFPKQKNHISMHYFTREESKSFFTEKTWFLKNKNAEREKIKSKAWTPLSYKML